MVQPSVVAGRSLFAFFALTFLLSWTCFIGAGAIGDGAPPVLAAVAYAVYLIGVFGPALVALALTLRAGGRPAVRALLSGILQYPGQARWWVFAFSYMAVAKLTAAVLHRLIAGAWPVFEQEVWLIMIPATVLSTPMQSGEEIGWRGYALPGLANRLGLGPASLVLGVIWACWHLPFFFIPGVDKTGQSFPLYLAAVVAHSVALAWLYWRTHGSLLITMFMHAAANNTTNLVPSATAGATNPWTFSASLVAWLAVAVFWIGAIYFLADMRGKRLEANVT